MKFTLLLRLTAFALLPFLAGCDSASTGNTAGKQNAPRPNIIFILADDLGYGDLGCYGQDLILTPHLDRMAAEGVRFTRFYAGATVCAPSRSSLLTGQHTGHTPIRGNKEVKPEGQWPLPDSALTIAEVLKQAGYATGDFGKWGLGFVGTEGDPLNQGFDRFFGYNCQREAHDYFPGHLWSDSQRIEYPNSPSNPEVYAPDMIHQEALRFLEANKSGPFFMYLSYVQPHAGLQLPEQDSIFESYKKKFGEEARPVPASWDGRGYAPQAYPRAAYAALVSKLDQQVGQILSKLRELGLDENTLVIFTSDNGPHKEGGHDPSHFNSSGGFKGVKRDLYEGGIRVPMIAWWPGKIQAGKESDHAGAFWDFMPTFAELAGQEIPGHTDGISLLPTLLGEGQQQEHDYLYWEFHEQGGKQAVSMGKWKGIRLNVNKDPQAPIELYDLEQDPGEEHNVAEAHPDIVEKIAAIMEEAHRDEADFPFGATHGSGS